MGCSFERQTGYYNYYTFLKNLDESNCKPNKMWVDKGNKYYNRSMKSWLQDNDTEMCSTHIEEKSVGKKHLLES